MHPRRFPARRAASARVLVLAALLFSPAVRLRAQTTGEPPVKLAEVVVAPSRFGVGAERPTTGATLTSDQLENLPQIGDDLYRSIARLPGLATNDFTAQFWVRGAPQGELLARYDGVDLIEPFHLKDIDGALSIVDPATLGRLDLTTGGFTTEYGDRLAGVLVMETKEPTALLTALNLSLTGVGGLNAGTLNHGRANWLVAARRGYPDVALRVAHRDDEVYPRYYDVTGKFEYALTPAQTISFHLLHAGDTLRYHKSGDPDLNSAYDSDYVWARWRGTFAAATGEGVLSLARLTWARDGSGRFEGYPFSLRDRRRLEVAAVRQDWEVPVGERVLVRGGIAAQRGAARYDYALQHSFTVVDAGRQTSSTETVQATRRPAGDTAGGFAAVRLEPASALIIEPGLRFDRHDYTGDRDWSPRLNAVWRTGRTTLRAAWGEYAQAQGLHELAVADGDLAFHRSERAEQRVIGVDRPLGHGISARLEAYERRTTRVRPRWENLDNPYELFPEAEPDRVALAPREARARGVEALVSGRAGPAWSWNASYALSRAEENLAGQWVPRARDQRHAFYADVTYALGRRWLFSAAWQYHSGWPTTDVQHTLVTLNNGRRVVVANYGPIYALRLPDYHRLDARVTRRVVLRHGELRLFLDLFNIYDRHNLIGYNHSISITGSQLTDTRTGREQLPFLPSAGVSWEQ